MDKNAKHNSHCVSLINFRLVWTLARRYRKKILVEPISTRLKQLLRDANQLRRMALKLWQPQ
jgi:REP element-mobilizing transposase RayT